MHDTGCSGMTQRDGMGREVGRAFGIGNTCTPMADSCQCMVKPIIYCKVNKLIKLKKNKKKERKVGKSQPGPLQTNMDSSQKKTPARVKNHFRHLCLF